MSEMVIFRPKTFEMIRKDGLMDCRQSINLVNCIVIDQFPAF